MNKKALQTSIPQEKYSDDELMDFEIVLNGKFEAAENHYALLQSQIDKGGKGKKIEELEEMKQLQKTQMDNLNKALDRIKDGSYGVCVVTGKLIDKERLEENPFATISADAKGSIAKPKESFLRKYNGYVFYEAGLYEETGLTQLFIYPDIALVDATPQQSVHTIYFENNKLDAINKGIEKAKEWVNALKRCRVCQCTEYNCKQCIDKTGAPCTWAEENLCSACVEKVVETPVAEQKPAPEIVTNFFQEINSLGYKNFTIRVLEKNGKLTVNFIPGASSLNFPPILLTDRPEEIDKAFFNSYAEKIKLCIESFVEPEPEEVKEEVQPPISSTPSENATTLKPRAAAKKQPVKKTAKRGIVKPPVVKKAIKKPVQKHKGVEKKKAAKRLLPIDLFAGVPEKE